MSLRGNITMVACGGGGNSLVDAIKDVEDRFEIFFINTSKTDLESLHNYDEVDKNYYCISLSNGTGRDRSLGKRLASKKGWNILEILKSFDTPILYLVCSLGGGSGSSIASVLLGAIKQLKEEGDFNKTINLIAILPQLDSADIILKNTLDTWNEIMAYDIVNNMIFIDNNNIVDGKYLEESDINQRFAELFDLMFEIPVANGRNFDEGNLSNVLNSKGCMYIYNLPNDEKNVQNAFQVADSNSILAKMYKKDNEIIEDGITKLRCSYIGTSFNNEDYKHDDITKRYKWSGEDFQGYNEENNLVLISGCLPPLYAIQVITAELQDREKNKALIKDTDLSKFIIDTSSTNISNNSEVASAKEEQFDKDIPKKETESKSFKKSMAKNKKSLFKMY